MATVVHIPLSELPNSQSLRDRVRNAEEIVLETADESYRFTRERKGPGRTAGEMLEMLKNPPYRDAEVDDEWSNDTRKIIAHRHTEPYKDPWE